MAISGLKKMSKYKLKKLISFLTPILLVFNYFILLDLIVLPTVQQTIYINYKHIDEKSNSILVDSKNKEHQVSYDLYLYCNTYDTLQINNSIIFNFVRDITIKSNLQTIKYNTEPLYSTVFFFTFLFIAWYILKGLHEYLYYIFFIPYMVMNFYFWTYLLTYRL